jgi:hypothetical protein
LKLRKFKTGGDQRVENTGEYHNPTRQRGIFANTAETQKLNPSLTRRVGIVANAQLQNLRFELVCGQHPANSALVAKKNSADLRSF